jgi:uracil-DNA glycosylase
MSTAYHELLDATIQHLEGMKARGVRHVAVAPETLRALALPAKFATPSASTGAPSTSPARPEFQKRAEPVPGAPRKTAPQIFSVPQNVSRVAASVAAPQTETPEGMFQASPPLDPQAKAAAFAALRERALACVKCPHLVAARQTVVFGVGNLDAQLMFVGEAPGADEDAQGEPFVGAAGQLLTKIILATGLKRSDVYIANILKCRPDMPAGSSGNRKPTPEEMQTCIPYLHEQIDLIRPKVIVALGATAVEGLLGKTIGITKLRGTWKTYRGTPLMPTYHPAYLLRNQAMSEKRRVWEDMLAVMEKLGLPVSEKQRNFFLKAQ